MLLVIVTSRLHAATYSSENYNITYNLIRTDVGVG